MQEKIVVIDVQFHGNIIKVLYFYRGMNPLEPLEIKYDTTFFHKNKDHIDTISHLFVLFIFLIFIKREKVH